MANIFISHRGEDIDLSEQLAQDLRNYGNDVWLDKWEIKLGDSIIEKMNQGLAGANYVILCYSSSGIDTPWMSAEWMSSFARQLGGANIKIIPVILSGGEPPAILADRQYIDLRSEWDNGVQKIVDIIS